MNKLAVVDLIFIEDGKKANGSPLNIELTLAGIRCEDVGRFSLNFYQNQPDNRTMRLSDTLRIPEYYERHFAQSNPNAKMMYVVYQGRKYHIKQILADRDTRRYILLDIEEVKA